MRIILFLLLAIYSQSLYSQKITIPSKIESELKTLYPDAQEIEWELQDGKYEAGFEEGDKDITVKFDSLGVLFSKEISLEIDELPEIVRLGIVKEFPGYKTNDILRIELKDQILYEVGVERGKKAFDVIFSSIGELMQVEDLSDE